jgi:hypothetical protein
MMQAAKAWSHAHVFKLQLTVAGRHELTHVRTVVLVAAQLHAAAQCAADSLL